MVAPTRVVMNNTLAFNAPLSNPLFTGNITAGSTVSIYDAAYDLQFNYTLWANIKHPDGLRISKGPTTKLKLSTS